MPEIEQRVIFSLDDLRSIQEGIEAIEQAAIGQFGLEKADLVLRLDERVVHAEYDGHGWKIELHSKIDTLPPDYPPPITPGRLPAPQIRKKEPWGATDRWVTASKNEASALSTYRHIVKRGSIMAACGLTVVSTNTWRNDRRKKPCPTCLERVDVPEKEK
jgi:hypothetical protein